MPVATAGEPTAVVLSTESYGRLPALHSLSECYEVPEPSLCEWAATVDLVASLKVTSVRAVRFPARVSGDVDRVVDVCLGELTPILEFEADVEKVHHGASAPDHLTFRVSDVQARAWHPRPRIVRATLQWMGASGDDIGIGVGSRFVAALDFDPVTATWNPRHSPFLEFEGDAVRWQAIEDDCSGNGVPRAAFPLPLAEFEATLSGCPTRTTPGTRHFEPEWTHPVCNAFAPN